MTDEIHQGKVALITGGGRGFGKAFGTALAERGAHVVLADIDGDAAAAAAAEISGKGGSASAVVCDVADEAGVAAAIEAIAGKHGGLDILVNNAGVLPEAKPAVQVSWAEWDAMLSLNLSAPWYLACRARELMTDGGVIVNNASTASFYPSRGLVAYNVSKSALVMLTRVLALEWARDGIRVVGVAPGKIDTDLVQPILAWADKRGLSLNPMGRIGGDGEVADLVAFLASDEAAYITGVTIPIDGGELLTAGSEPGR
jgi:NAD(P)-dependent dehydrogenase (short-subunit alcohol dehydrogenase family)